MHVFFYPPESSQKVCVLTPGCPLLPVGLAMVLTAAFEFDPRSNKEATIRPTDNIEVPQVGAVPRRYTA